MCLAEKKWPEFYPDNTPPIEAIATEGQSFRLVDNHPPTRADFKSTFEEYPRRKLTGAKLVLACGTSQFRDLQDIKKKRDLFPALRNKLVAIGDLQPELGKTMNTFEPSHHTVWYICSAQPQMLFEVMENE
jgi:hypothetical protein